MFTTLSNSKCYFTQKSYTSVANLALQKLCFPQRITPTCQYFLHGHLCHICAPPQLFTKISVHPPIIYKTQDLIGQKFCKIVFDKIEPFCATVFY